MSTDQIVSAKPDDLPGQKIISESSAPRVDKRSILAKLESGEFRSVNNFAGDKMAKWRQQARATGPDCIPFKEFPAEGIPLETYYCHRVEMVSQNGGEIIEPIRVVLITPDGKCYGFVSDFIARELDSLIEMWGEGPWKPPLNIRVIKAESRKGNNFYSIQPA